MMKKRILVPFVLAICMSFTTLVTAQNMATKKIIVKYETDYIPTFKADLASLTKDPELSKIDVNIDFESFGNDHEELDGAVRQLLHAKGAIVFLAKDDVGKKAIHEGLKTITVRMVGGAREKSISIKDGNLTLETTTFKDGSNLNTSNDIQHFLEENL